jgi:hypothetical protein
MTEKELARFKQEIYEPYSEAWNVMKWMRDTEPKDDKFWQEFTLKALNFPMQYGDSEIAKSISRVILDAGSEYQRIIKGQV